MKDQCMKQFRLLAFAGLFALSAAQSNATLIYSKFTTDPSQDGWQIFGDAALFHWDSADQNLAVTWDSSQTNSYYYHLLDMTYTKTNDFLVMFDLKLNDIAVGTTPGKTYTFEIALGLLNTTNATGPEFIRGAGSAPNIVEFTYFPDDGSGTGASLSTLFISAQNGFSSGGFTFPLGLATNVNYHVVMTYIATNQTMFTTMTADGVHFGPIEDAYLGDTFDDFYVNAISINSYSDEGQFPAFAGSVLAHGTVDNFAFASPPPVRYINATSPGTIEFGATTNWLYTLERTQDFQSWTNVLTTTAGRTGSLVLQDTNAPSSDAYYRVKADLP